MRFGRNVKLNIGSVGLDIDDGLAKFLPELFLNFFCDIDNGGLLITLEYASGIAHLLNNVGNPPADVVRVVAFPLDRNGPQSSAFILNHDHHRIAKAVIAIEEHVVDVEDWNAPSLLHPGMTGVPLLGLYTNGAPIPVRKMGETVLFKLFFGWRVNS